jgi:hypothetical protein
MACENTGLRLRSEATAHSNVLTGADFFTVGVLSWRGLVTYYVLFFIGLKSRRVSATRIDWLLNLVSCLR